MSYIKSTLIAAAASALAVLVVLFACNVKIAHDAGPNTAIGVDAILSYLPHALVFGSLVFVAVLLFAYRRTLPHRP
jgi:hypothetical protein